MSRRSTDLPTLEQIRRERSRLQYRSRYGRALRSTLRALAVLVATLWLPVLRIYGSSMWPTLMDGQIVLCVKTCSFAPGDVTAFYHGNKLLIKRYVAGPSDWVDIDDSGNVTVNSEPLEEPYLAEKAFGQTNISLPYQVPEGRYFVMGDNRDASVDSRNTAVGPIAMDQVVGKVFFRIWPLREFGVVK